MQMTDRVRNLVGSYAEAVLRNDPVLFADTWAEDAVWSMPGAPTIVGRDGIARSFRDRRAGFRLCVRDPQRSDHVGGGRSSDRDLAGARAPVAGGRHRR